MCATSLSINHVSLLHSLHSCILIGLEFWKIGSRKVYAIPCVDNTDKIRSRKQDHHSIDSDADDYLPRKNTCGAEFDSLKNKVLAMQDQLCRIFTIDRRMKIPVAL